MHLHESRFVAQLLAVMIVVFVAILCLGIVG
jgi:hypothetical protein